MHESHIVLIHACCPSWWHRQCEIGASLLDVVPVGAAFESYVTRSHYLQHIIANAPQKLTVGALVCTPLSAPRLKSTICTLQRSSRLCS